MVAVDWDLPRCGHHCQRAEVALRDTEHEDEGREDNVILEEGWKPPLISAEVAQQEQWDVSKSSNGRQKQNVGARSLKLGCTTVAIRRQVPI